MRDDDDVDLVGRETGCGEGRCRLARTFLAALFAIAGVEHDKFLARVHDHRREGNRHLVARQIVLREVGLHVFNLLVVAKDRMDFGNIERAVIDGRDFEVAQLEAVMGWTRCAQQRCGGSPRFGKASGKRCSGGSACGASQ